MKTMLKVYILIIIGLCTYIPSYAQEGASSSDFNFLSGATNTTGNLSDFPTGHTFSANTRLIADDILLYNETEIRDYPLTDLPIEEIKAVFMILDSGNLSKLLLNIDDIAIKNIYEELTPVSFNKLIEDIPESTKREILNRIQ
jgi:hypothetical protein